MDIAQIYDQFVADHFDEDHFQIYQDARDLALAQIQRVKRPLRRILDLGMGTGEWLLKLGTEFPEAACHGVELSEKMMEQARRKFAERGRAVQIYHEDANHFGRHIAAKSMDLITVHFVLNYIDRERVIAEAFRCLDAGGLLSVASSTHESFSVLHEIGKQFLPAEEIKAQLLVPEDLMELEKHLKAKGFKILNAQPFKKPLIFRDFDHFCHFAMHSGWLADPIFLKHVNKETFDTYREYGKSLFPLEDCFQAAIVLAEKTK